MVDIKNEVSSSIFFDCNYWSAFTKEDEKLFVGNRNALTFNNIRNVKQGEHYLAVINIMNILFRVFGGWVLEPDAPDNRDVDGLRELVSAEEKMEYISFPYKSEWKIPQYVSLLFHQFLKKTKQISINTWPLSLHFIKYNKYFDHNWYGYQKFDGLFRCRDKITINYTFFVKILPNLEEFIVFKAYRSGGYKKSIVLDAAFTSEMLNCIDFINNKSSSVLHTIKIVEPIDIIEMYIKDNLSNFAEKGWGLKKCRYESPIDGVCNNTLSIKRK